MVDLDKIETIKNVLRAHIGQRVMLAAVKGRRRFVIKDCTIENVYPGIFVVRTKDEMTGYDKRISFSYSDILTKTIVMKRLDERSA